jgi:hypothetical protein
MFYIKLHERLNNYRALYRHVNLYIKFNIAPSNYHYIQVPKSRGLDITLLLFANRASFGLIILLNISRFPI